LVYLNWCIYQDRLGTKVEKKIQKRMTFRFTQAKVDRHDAQGYTGVESLDRKKKLVLLPLAMLKKDRFTKTGSGQT